MEVSNQVNLLLDSGFILMKILFVIFAIVYFVFTLIIVRQVYLMTDTVITEGGSLLRFLAIILAGVSLGIVVLFIGLT